MEALYQLSYSPEPRLGPRVQTSLTAPSRRPTPPERPCQPRLPASVIGANAHVTWALKYRTLVIQGMD